MGLIFGLIKKLIKLSACFLIFAAIIVLIPNLPPYGKFTSIPLEPTQPRTGPLAPNNALNNAEKAYVDKLLGPENFQVYNGDLYTSLATGEVVKVSPGGHVTFVTKVGQPCSGLSHEHICGRPLGFQIDESKNVMYLSDAYHGIWKVDLKNDKKQLLVSPRVSIKGREPKLFNSLTFTKNGDLYWTDSSSEFQLRDGAMSVLTDPSGRLFHYNAAKNQSKVLLDDLWFPNGIVLSPDNKFLVVAETARFRLIKYYIEGPKKGKSEVFVAGLPGNPDNIRVLPDGSGVLVGLYVTFDEEHPLLTRSMAAAPLARKFLARVQRLIEIPFEYINTLYPHVIFEDIVYHIGHFKSVSGLVPPMSGLVQVDWEGNIVASYYNTDGSLRHISDAVVFNNRLHTGNPHNQNFIGSVPIPPLLKKAFETKPETAKQTKPVEAQKPKVVEQPREVKKETPKPAEKPVQQPKPTPAPKPVEQPKPAQPKPTPAPPKQEPPKPQEKQAKPTPKPEVKTPPPTPKPTPKAAPPADKLTPKGSQESKPAPKAAEAKPVPKSAEAKPMTKPAETKPAAKPAEAKPAIKPAEAKPAAKPVETKPAAKPAVKPAETKPEKVTKPKEAEKPKVAPKQNRPEQIPIKEEIPSDTAKPPRETLKVIKKGGPAEIPNPHL